MQLLKVANISFQELCYVLFLLRISCQSDPDFNGSLYSNEITIDLHWEE